VKRRRSSWLTRWVKRLLDWLSCVFSRPSQSVPSAAPPLVPRIHQNVTGDRNVVTGRVESGGRLTVDQSSRCIKVDGDAQGIFITGHGNTIHSLSPARDLNPFGVPYPRNRYFSGREGVLSQIHERLTQTSAVAMTQVQAISGLGGIGKTQTAVEYAYRYYYDQRTYNTVFWVKADTSANLATDFAGIADQLALPVAQSTQSEKIPAVQSWLTTHRNWLLIFDNADIPDLLIDFLPTNPHGRVLITSRASIFDQLGIRNPLFLDILSLDESISFLLERTGYERTEANVAATTELNKELDGLPLALEQASSFIVQQKIDVPTYLRAYKKKGLSQLEKAKAKTGRYPSSVMKTWIINFEAVTTQNPAASALLEMSAFLAPDAIPYCMLTSGKEYLGELLHLYIFSDANDDDDKLLAVNELLALLSQYSLIWWEPERQRYSIHRLVQSAMSSNLTKLAADRWIERAIDIAVSAYPGKEFEHWEVCTQLLPHWLKIVRQAQRTEYKAESLGMLLNQAGSFLRDQGRYSEAEPLCKRALILRQQILGEYHLDVADSQNNLARLYYLQGRYNEAEPLYEKALALRKRILGEEHIDVANSLNNLALLYSTKGQYSESEPLYEQSLCLYKRILGEEHPNVAMGFNNLAGLYFKQSRYSKAELLYEQTLALYKRTLGEEHPDVASSLNNLANLYKEQGRYRKAEPLYEKALKLRKRSLGAEHPDVAISLNSLATLYEKQGLYIEARQLYEQALALRIRTLGEHHLDVATSLNNLAGVLYCQELYDESRQLCQQALSLYQQLLGTDNCYVATSLNNLATLYEEQGFYDKAKSLYERALSLYQRLLGDKHPNVQSVEMKINSLKDRN
jgi:tetratricopeptide (TPR) repeat protein